MMLVPAPVVAAADDPYDVLVFSRTAGFRHDSIAAGTQAIRELGAANGFTVTATEDPARFTAAGLAPYEAVIFLNTTGDALDNTQQGAFETLIQDTPQAIACYQISGNFDYIVHFICRSVGDYVLLHNELIEQEPNIASVTTNVIMSETKKFAGYPVKELVEPAPPKDN